MLEMDALLLAGIRALQAVPPLPPPPPRLLFEFAGHFYWLQVRPLVYAEVFDSPSALTPLVGTLCAAEAADDAPR